MTEASPEFRTEAPRPPLLVIAGPTAAGKTGLAVSLARALGGELIGADSVQVYRGFDIGSAKPTERELGNIRHHLLDVAHPDELYGAEGLAAPGQELRRGNLLPGSSTRCEARCLGSYCQ